MGLRRRAGLADDGLTWTSLANAHTTDEHDPAALASIIAELPGFNGDADWHAESFDLSAWAGKTVLLRFRMMTDGSTLGNGGAIEAGWQVDDVKLGGTLLSDGTLAGWGTEAPPIAGYTLQLVSIGARARQAGDARPGAAEERQDVRR